MGNILTDYANYNYVQLCTKDKTAETVSYKTVI